MSENLSIKAQGEQHLAEYFKRKPNEKEALLTEDGFVFAVLDERFCSAHCTKRKMAISYKRVARTAAPPVETKPEDKKPKA